MSSDIGSFLDGEIPYGHLYDNPDGYRAIAPSIDRIREDIPWLAEQDGWIVWEWSDEAQKIPHRGADPKKRTEWQEPGSQATLEDAWESYQEHDHLDGIGFVFNGTEPEILEDFDDCINPWGFTISHDCLEDALENDDEPVFYSTSGTGAHRYPVAASAEDTTQHPHEVYIGDGNNNRWAAITGFKIAGNPDDHGPDRSERVNELSEEHNEADGKAVDLREFDFDADPAEVDDDAPVPEAVVEAYGGDVPRCVAGLIYVLGTHDPTDPDGPGWGQQTFTRYSHLLMLLAHRFDADPEAVVELAASFKSPAIAAAQRGEHPKKDAKPAPYGEGVPWDLDYQTEMIAGKVSDDDLSAPKVETIEGHCNIKIEDCGCPVHSYDGAGSADGSGASDDTWSDVKSLLKSDANGTTTRAYNMAAGVIDEEHHFAKIRESGSFYYYNPDVGFYVRRAESHLEELLNDKLGEEANINRRREVIERVAGENYVESDDFRPPDGRVNVENGVLDLETKRLEDHSPEFYFTSQVRAEWPEDGKADAWAEAWWLRALADGNDDPGEQQKINEFVGYCLESWHHDLEKNMFFVGYRRSGKSTVQEAIEALFGGFPTVSNITPQQLADTKFDAASLRDAQLNTVNDINATKIEDSGTLKRAFSGERMKLEEKYKMPEFAAPTAKHLFTANWLPRVVGSDEALYRRLLIVEFKDPLEEGEQDPNYKQRLKRPDVRQAILVNAVEARDRLREQKRFTNDRGDVETREIWNKWQDSHKLFLFTHFLITGDHDDNVEKESYWMEYEFWAGQNGFEIKSHNSISQSLQYVPRVFTPKDSDYYRGLRWLEGAREHGDDTEQTEFLTQHQRKQQVHFIIKDMAGRNGPVPIDRVLGYAEAKGLAESKVQDDIESMVKRGDLIEHEAGKLQPP